MLTGGQANGEVFRHRNCCAEGWCNLHTLPANRKQNQALNPGQEAQRLSLLEWPEGRETGSRILVVDLTDSKSHFSLWACFLISPCYPPPPAFLWTLQGTWRTWGVQVLPETVWKLLSFEYTDLKGVWHLDCYKWLDELTPKFEMQRNQVLLKATCV